jgi:transposase InsO family protein
VRYAFIESQVEQYPVERMCHTLEVSVSGYYAWRKHEASGHQQMDERLLEQVRGVHQASRGLYGSPRVHAALQQQGIRCGRKRVARLMHDAGIYSRRRPRRRVRTTDSHHAYPVAPNILRRDFSATAPNQKWVGDIVGLWTSEGWLYLAAILDTFSRRIVGWAMSAFRDEALVTSALRMALAGRHRDPLLVHHSDRGSQYAATDYRALLLAHGITMSMSAKADPYDNAMMESFFSTLRAECTDLQALGSRRDARTVVFEFIEVFYNRQRLHSALGYTSPVQFETAFLSR